jgi:hypothetical protein
MNIYCVKGVAAYHEFACACAQCVLLCRTVCGLVMVRVWGVCSHPSHNVCSSSRSHIQLLRI